MKKTSLLLLFIGCWYLAVSQDIRKVNIKELVAIIDSSKTPLVINFWASWCGPCVREIPWFEKSVAEFSKDKVKLILVSIDFADDYPATIRNFAKKNGYRSEIIWLNETNADAFCPQIDKSWDGAIPVTLMVNNRKQYRKFFGEQLPEAKLVQELKLLVE